MPEVFLTLLFEKLKIRKVTYCVLRNYEQLPISLDGSDLDILIDHQSVSKFYAILDEVLEQTNGKIIVKYGQLAPQICIAGMSGKHLYGLQIDVFESILPYRTVPMFPVDFLLKRAKRHHDIAVADDDDANILAFLKETLNNGVCKEKYFEDAKKSWSQNTPIYKEALLPLYDAQFIEMLSEIFAYSYDRRRIAALSRHGRKLLTRGVATKAANFRSRLSRFYRFFAPPGFTIAVLGTDGAGKTTIIDAISEPLNEAVHNALYYEHMRPNLIPGIAQLLGKKRHKGPVTDPHAAKPSGMVGSLLRLFYYSFDYIVGYWIKIYPVTVRKSCIWIFDRYYYDYLIDPRRARINLPGWIIRSVGVLIPKPDLILCLGTDPAVIHERKPELSLKEVARQVDLLKSFCQRTRNAIWIDTGKSLDDSIRLAFGTIVDKMASRYER